MTVAKCSVITIGSRSHAF